LKPKTYSVRVPLSQFDLWPNKTPLLLHLDMELTERCNNNCSHCYINLPADDFQAKKRELIFEEIQSILNEAASLGCLTVRFTGGEPLLRDDFEDIYIYSRKLGLKVKIFTNGTLITPHLAELFSRFPPGDTIQVSLYGWNRKSYEAVSRVPGSFEGVQRGIKLLNAHNIPFIINAVVLPLKITAFQELEAWIKTVPLLNVPQPQILALHLSCRDRDETRDNRIKAFRVGPQEQLALEARKPESYIDDLIKFCSRFCGIPGDILFGCGAGVSRGCVDAYGNLQLCLLLRHPETVYHLKIGSLTHAILDFFPKIRKFKAKDPLYLERCARCFLHSLCEQCPAVSWMENRSLDSWPKHFCDFTQAQARFIGLLKEGEKSWEVTDWQERINKLFDSKKLFSKKQKNKTSIHIDKRSYS